MPRTTKRILQIQSRLQALFRRAIPRVRDRDISWVCADLAGLWEVSHKHEACIRRLMGMRIRNRRDIEKLAELSTEIEVNWLSQASDHLDTLAKLLPRIQKALYRSSEEAA
jgi:hypothetical protein